MIQFPFDPTAGAPSGGVPAADGALVAPGAVADVFRALVDVLVEDVGEIPDAEASGLPGALFEPSPVPPKDTLIWITAAPQGREKAIPAEAGEPALATDTAEASETAAAVEATETAEAGLQPPVAESLDDAVLVTAFELVAPEPAVRSAGPERNPENDSAGESDGDPLPRHRDSGGAPLAGAALPGVVTPATHDSATAVVVEPEVSEPAPAPETIREGEVRPDANARPLEVDAEVPRPIPTRGPLRGADAAPEALPAPARGPAPADGDPPRIDGRATSEVAVPARQTSETGPEIRVAADAAPLTPPTNSSRPGPVRPARDVSTGPIEPGPSARTDSAEAGAPALRNDIPADRLVPADPIRPAIATSVRAASSASRPVVDSVAGVNSNLVIDHADQGHAPDQRGAFDQRETPETRQTRARLPQAPDPTRPAAAFEHVSRSAGADVAAELARHVRGPVVESSASRPVAAEADIEAADVAPESSGHDARPRVMAEADLEARLVRATSDDATPASGAGARPVTPLDATSTPGATVARSVATAEAPRAFADLQDAAPRNTESIVRSLRLLTARGGGDAHIKLEPQQFGDLSVVLKVRDGRVQAELRAASAGVREWLQSNQMVLRQALGDQGLALDRIDVQDTSTEAEPRDPDQERNAREESTQEDRRQRRRRLPENATFEVVA